MHLSLPGPLWRLLWDLFRAEVRRRTVVLAAALGLAALTAGIGAIPAQAASGRVSVTITAMSPQEAGPGSTVTVQGTISNTTSVAQAGLAVQLTSSAAQFVSRDEMDEFLSDGSATGLVTAGNPYAVPVSVPAGGTVRWSASFPVSSVGMTAFGVYPVTAELTDIATGTVLTSDQTLLPYWPGQRASGLVHKLQISWVWPLVDQPHHQACAALSNNSLAASLGSGGRLATLLDAGADNPGADLTWVVDPALLSDADTMTSTYWVGGTRDCVGDSKKSPSKAAAGWLAALKAVTASQPTVLTPYANVDVSALVHQGLADELTRSYDLGEKVAGTVLGRTAKPTIALPPGGTADLSVLTNLAAYDGIRTVVLSSSEMPPDQTGVYEPDDAVTSVRTAAGVTVNVLLADDGLTSVLARGDTGSGSLSAGTEFEVDQQFLAETAMIADEAPDSARSVVVEPPEDWSPTEALADDLLAETTSAPWLQTAALNSLSSAPDSERSAPRKALPDNQDSPGELSRSYLTTVSAVGARLGDYESMLYDVKPSYTESLDEALAATESAAWRGRGAAQGLALARSLGGYLSNAEQKVKIITSRQVQMGGSSGQVPVSIENGLQSQAIRVKLNVSVPIAFGNSSQLAIGSFKSLIVVQPGLSATVRLPVKTAPAGSTVLRLSLTSADGRALPIAHAQLTVQSTRYGRAILILIGAAIGVLLFTSTYRGVRRRLRGDPPVSGEEPDPAGSVGAGTSSARHPTEAPDELADARRWADDA